MLKENHIRAIKEGLSAIEWAIDQGLEDKQITIGFYSSLIAVNLLELYLHEINILKIDNMLKHEWFKSKNKIKEKLDFEFEEKEKILELMFKIEEKRNILCYGKRQRLEILNNILEHTYELKDLIESLGVKIETD
ncbi:hypothetical protein J4216_04335 [Candidatus Woesearchaeota archaeon]|nr:hypothetical protein [Candidatus Woesearchaeota archaeon]